MAEKLLYPISNQTFEKIRSTGRVYVDKTEYIHKLLEYSDYVFLSRPRRFGKSLLLSTFEAYFRGKRELFKGLAIDRLEAGNWEEFPVIHLDLSKGNYPDTDALQDTISPLLAPYEEEYGLMGNDCTLSIRLDSLVRKMHRAKGKNVVVLIDEYDSPLTQNIKNPDLLEEMRRVLHAFYATLKSLDPYIRFCMLTGVTKYGKMSIFSGMNNLRDISFLNEYAALCGITDAELHSTLHAGVEEFAAAKGIEINEAYHMLKSNYDGYHFSRDMTDIYNPYSLLNALSDKEISNYWFETGTPTMLVRVLEGLDMDIESLDGAEASVRELNNIYTPLMRPLALFYQSGYLTLKSYDAEDDAFTLGFPNHEVRQGFMQALLTIYTDNDDSDSFIRHMRRYLRKGECLDFIQILRSYLADIPFDLRKRVAKYENYYHAIFYSIFYLIGTDVKAEYHTSQGSIDLVVKTADFIYIIELKINGNASEAIAQIKANGYATPFANDSRTTICIGLGFSKQSHTIDSYEIL